MFRRINNDKISNVLNYFASQIDYLSMTKTLKLLYILDETSIKETGTPVTWLDYKVWENGPVAIDVYNEIKHQEVFCYQGKELSLLHSIQLEKKFNTDRNSEEVFLKPKGNFDETIFNRYELNLLETIVFKYGNWNATELINFLHEEGSLWHKMVSEHNLINHFQQIGKRTNHSIEFNDLLEDNPVLQMAAKSSFEALSFQESIS
ncbi:Panacea domain-containing protein [Flavobacterium yafengii]|uniref:Panacea domain-containing protein n=1 Tax=Flavobacterium yafengii TaxID=3041253 RepID=A0AAW6TL06_9FLAO|nr:Panacea domain-containing protein [Flavobacterium yafengii]MDI5898890.1 Panacea domain-containing protein [Flavobacterium yafengii]MDI5948080.1 Panacea domain-containing protein [Flavobacterium yafengii]MDI6047320.1 Panacea domain-containing protein [Flavobacterium yafengii]